MKTFVPDRDRKAIEKIFDGSMKGDKIIEAIQKLEERQRMSKNSK